MTTYSCRCSTRFCTAFSRACFPKHCGTHRAAIMFGVHTLLNLAARHVWKKVHRHAAPAVAYVLRIVVDTGLVVSWWCPGGRGGSTVGARVGFIRSCTGLDT